MKIPILNKSHFFSYFLVLFLTGFVHAQIVNPQVLPFDKICAGDFNSFEASFNYSGFPAGTTFEVILSDNLGSFTNPTSTTTLSVLDVSPVIKKITFAVPTNLTGSENYRLRVKASTGYISSNFFIKDPINIGGTLTYFPAYFKSFEGVYFINNKLASATICAGGEVMLSIDNPTPNITNSSPANFPNIKYKWFKDSVVVPGQTSSSLLVSTAGTYYVILDYGSCTDSASRSNEVKVTVSAGGSSGTVSSSLGNPFCGSSPTILSASVTGNTYQWYKNNLKIDGAINATYSTDQSGLYAVKIDFGGCSSTYSIDLVRLQIESSINIPDTSVITEGASKTVVVTTTASNPTFEWYKDDSLIPESTTNTFVVTTPGKYKVKVIQNTGCTIVDEIPFTVNSALDVVTIPNLISPNNDGANDTWNIPQEYINTNTGVVIMDGNGKVVFTTDNYLNNWPEKPIEYKSVNPVYYYTITAKGGKAKMGSITIVK